LDETCGDDLQLKYKYYQVFEHYPDENKPKRLIYTFPEEPAAHGLVEYIYQNDPIPVLLKVEEHETPTKL
jgi:hypothetical protein